MSVAAPTPEVPSDWDITKAEDVCEVQNGYAFKSVHFNDKTAGVPLIRIRDVHTGSSKTYYSGEYNEKYVVSDGDLLVGMDGEFRVRRWNAGKGLLNQRVCRLLPVDGPMETDFLYYSIGRPLKQIEDFTPFTTVKHISAKQIREIELPLPPLPEQKKIAHILSTVQRAIEAQERIIQTATELKKALMHKLFTEGLRNEPQKQTEIGPIPESWEICTVPDSLQKTQVGRRQQIPAKEIAETGVHPVVDQGQTFVSGFTDDSERLIDFDLPLIIFGDHTRHFKFVDFPFVLGADGTKVLKPKPGLFDPKFFFYALVVLKLPSRGYNRHFKLLKEKTIPKPSIKEQREIANTIDATENKANLAESKRSTLNDLFRTLLHELMTAKTRVQDSNLSSN